MSTNVTTAQAIKLINEFLTNNNQQIFILKGISSSGKTTLIAKILRLINSPAVVMAPTGASVVAIKSKIPEVSAKTIHQVIYKRSSEEVELSDNDGINNVVLNYVINYNNQYTVYIVDAAEGISLSNENDSIVHFGTGNVLQDMITATGVKENKSKIIILGDPYNLSLNGQLSLDSNYYKENNLKVTGCTLAEIINRPKSLINTVKQAALKIEDPRLVGPATFTADQTITIINPDKDGISDHKVVNQFVKLDPLKTHLITYSIERAQEFNQLIRRQFGFDREIEKGDLLTVSRNKYDIPLKCNGKYVRKDIYSGEVLKVVNVYPKSDIHTDPMGTYTLTFRAIQFKFISPQTDLNTYSAYLLENTLKQREPRITNKEITDLYRDFYDRYKLDHKDKIEELRQNNRIIESDKEHRKHDARTNVYYQEAARLLGKINVQVPKKDKNYKSNISELLHHYPQADPKRYCKRQKLPDDFYESLHNNLYYNCIEAQYSYASNVYRSINSSWDNVFVDLNNGQQQPGTPKWLYSTVSRANKRLFVFNVPSIFTPSFKIEVRKTTFSRLRKRIADSSVVPMDKFNIDKSPLTASLMIYLENICKKTGAKLEGINSKHLKDNYYLLIYLQTDSLLEIQFYRSKKGWSKANISSDQLEEHLSTMNQAVVEKIRDINSNIGE